MYGVASGIGGRWVDIFFPRGFFGSLVLSPPANDPLVSSFFHSPFPEPASLLTYGESRPRKTTLPVMPVNTAFRRAPVLEKWWAETPAICTPVV